MKKVKLFFLILLVQLVAFSCKKKNECETIKDAPPEFLNYFYFNEGSWWVYRLKDSGEVYDTVRVRYREKNYETPNNHEGIKPCIYYHYVGFSHTNQRFINPKAPQDKRFILRSTGGSNGVWGIEHQSVSTYSHMGLFFKWPVVEGEIIDINGVSNKITTKVQDTNEVELMFGKIPNSVHINISYEYSWNIEVPDKVFTDVWIARNAGILRYRFYDSSTWELIDYRIK